jgi:hypothetical protein
MKASFYVFFALVMFVPTFVLAESMDTALDITLFKEECIQLQTAYAKESPNNCADVTLSTKIRQVKVQLQYIQSQLLPFLATDKRMHHIVSTFNEDMQEVIHQMTIEHLLENNVAKPEQ